MQLFIHKQLINEQWPPPCYNLLVITRKLIFGNEKPLRYNRDFVLTKFDINRFEIQSNIEEMLGNG